MHFSTRLLSFVLLSLPLQAQTTWYVQAGASGDGSQGNPFPLIQTAIDAALDGDSIEVGPGTYNENLNFLGKAVHANGTAGAAQTLVDANGVGIVARFNSGEGPATRLSGLTFMDGAAVMVDRPGSGSQWHAGGGVVCEQTSPTFVDCVIRDCSTSVSIHQVARKGSGVYLLDSSATFTDCSISGNRALEEGGGAAIFGNSSPVFQGCSFTSNITWYQQTSESGGGAYSNSTAAILPLFMNCGFGSNYSGKGAGLAGKARAVNSSFSGNSGTLGGGLYGVPEVRNCTIIANRVGEAPAGAAKGGGAMNCTLYDCIIRSNLAPVGGGLTGSTAYGCTIEDNSAIGGGGADGSTLWDCVVVGNHASIDGGGLWGSTANDCIISENEAVWQGAGAYGSTLNGCLIEDNVGLVGSSSHPSVGGGIRGGSATLCIIQGNVADYGGAADNATLDRCSVGGNSARLGYGALNNGTVSNSILWGNGDAPANFNVTANYSCIEGGTTGNGNVASDPQTWVAYGSTDMNLLPGSPCIDSADPSLPLDADGSPADMGALPYDATYVGAPSTFCQDNKLNSGGCYAVIQATGDVMSLSGTENLELQVTKMISGKPTWLFWSTSVDTIPFLGGTLCLAPPLVRGTPKVSTAGGPSGCPGTMTSDLSAADFAQAGLSPFTKIYVQGFFRDSAAADGTGAGLTNAIEFVLLP